MNIEKLELLNKYLIILYKDGEFNTTLKAGKLELVVNPDWDRTARVKDSAIVYKSGAKCIIPEGSKVWVNYLVASQDKEPIHKDEKGSYFMIKEEEVYLYEYNGAAKTIGEYIIVEPEEEEKEIVSASGIVIPNENYKEEKYGSVVFAGDDVKELQVGQRLMLEPKFHYKFKYDERDLYRVHSRLGVIAMMV